MPQAREKALELFGIVSLDGGHPFGPGVQVVAFRELAALVGEAPYVRAAPTADAVHRYRSIVEAVFRTHTVLPAPCGTVFRTRDTLVRWLELHYFTLLDALAFVDDKAMARVVVAPAEVPETPAEPPAEPPQPAPGAAFPPAAKVVDVQASATESFRLLRRHAVASIPVPQAPSNGTAAASFLVDRERWPLFADMVKEEAKRLPGLRIDVTGPWPPYDFVRMQFGG
jgi:gas vesicle protein GvpL/GvpF